MRLAQVRELRGVRHLVTDSRALPPQVDPASGPRDPVRRDREVERLIDEMLGSGRFVGRDAASCLPAGQVMYRTMRLAPMPADDLAHAVHWKMAAEVAAKPDGFKCAVLTQHRVNEAGKARTEVVAVGAEVAVLERHASMLLSAGLSPVAIDCCSNALIRGVHRSAAAELCPPSMIVLHVGADVAALAIARDGRTSYYRPAGQGLEQLDRLLARVLETTSAEARQVRLALSDPAESSAWPVRSVSRDGAETALADAARMYGRELAREVSLSLHYCAETIGAALPDLAVIAADEPLADAAVAALEAQCDVTFTPAGTLLRPDWRDALATTSGGGTGADAGHGTGSTDPAPWMAAVGLAFYPVAGETDHADLAGQRADQQDDPTTAAA